MRWYAYVGAGALLLVVASVALLDSATSICDTFSDPVVRAECLRMASVQDGAAVEGLSKRGVNPNPNPAPGPAFGPGPSPNGNGGNGGNGNGNGNGGNGGNGNVDLGIGGIGGGQGFKRTLLAANDAAELCNKFRDASVRADCLRMAAQVNGEEEVLLRKRSSQGSSPSNPSPNSSPGIAPGNSPASSPGNSPASSPTNNKPTDSKPTDAPASNPTDASPTSIFGTKRSLLSAEDAKALCGSFADAAVRNECLRMAEQAGDADLPELKKRGSNPNPAPSPYYDASTLSPTAIVLDLAGVGAV